MSELSDNLKTLRKKHGLTQADLAAALDMSKSVISMYESGQRLPSFEVLEALADYYNVSLSALRGETAATSLRIPVLGTIPAGIPIEAIEDIIDWEEIPASMQKGGREYFALLVRGDSMYPRYEEGDILIVRKQDTCESGDDCIVMVNGNDATFKRVRLGENTLTLQPINPQYEIKTFTAKEIETLPVRILGVVVELRRKVK